MKTLKQRIDNVRNMTKKSRDVELWKKYISNPDEAIGEDEKKVWMELQCILNDLLLELKNNRKVEINFTKSEINHVKKLLKSRNEVVANFNKIMDTTDTWEKTQSFLQAIREFNFDDVNYVYLIVELAILLMITDTECFKTLLLFHLKDVNYKASSFLTTMKKDAPKSWKKLKPFIDNKFRNALAHGTWAIEKNHVVLFEDAKLVPFENLDLGNFLGKVKKQNLLFGCLSSVISDKIEKEFFGN